MLSIIFVNYKTSSQIDKCLESIEKCDDCHSDYEYIVIDNNSNDSGFEKLKGKYPYLTLIHAEENGGFAYGINIGIKVASGDIIFMLNPDTYIQDNAIQKMYEKALAGKDISFLGPKLIFPDGSNQSFYEPKSYLTLWRLFCERFFLHRAFKKIKFFNGYYRTYMDYDQPNYVEQLGGAALMFRRDVISKIGLMDENYFMYFEESDWCYRAVKAGLKLLYYPDAVVVHEGGLISDGNWKRSTKDYLKSFKYYFIKNFSKSHYYVAYILFLLGSLIRALGLLLLRSKKAGYYFYYVKYMLGMK